MRAGGFEPPISDSQGRKDNQATPRPLTYNSLFYNQNIYKIFKNYFYLNLNKKEELILGKEGKAIFYYYQNPNNNIVNSKLKVFYNPLMAINRDLSNVFLYEISKKETKIKKAASLMAATGVREIRWKKELNIKEVIANDWNKYAVELIKKNSKLNNVELIIKQKDARFFDEKADYFDIDPFGSPLPFLQPIILPKYFKITATDLSVLCSFKHKALLKYKGFANKKGLCHIQAIKILIKRILDFLRFHEIGAKPLFSYYYKHHISIFFKKTRKWKEKKFSIYDYEFLQNLDINFYIKKYEENEIIANKETIKLLEKIKNEGFKGYYYFLPKIYSIYKIKPISIEEIIKKSYEIGVKTVKTHFSGEIVKSELKPKEFVKLLKNI